MPEINEQVPGDVASEVLTRPEAPVVEAQNTAEPLAEAVPPMTPSAPVTEVPTIAVPASDLSLEGDGVKAEALLKEPLMVYEIAAKQIDQGDPYSAVLTRNQAQSKLFPGTQVDGSAK